MTGREDDREYGHEPSHERDHDDELRRQLDGLPPELRDAFVTDEDDAAAERRADARQRLRGLVIGFIALIVALALIGYGLLPLFRSPAPQDQQPTQGPLPAVPAGTVESFGEQQPLWHECGNGGMCADVYAPIDWDDPAGERLTLRLVKLPARSGDPLGTLFVNPGGPGVPGASYVLNSSTAVSDDVREQYDVIGWDPRGVGGSTPVTCLGARGMDEFLFGDPDELSDLERGSEAWITLAETEAAAFGEACADRSGELLGHIDTASTVRDLDMLRRIVGEPQLNYVGYSYGTYIGARYADAYPELVGRMVLDGAVNPETTQFEVVREQTLGFEAALRSYVRDCLSRSGCPFSGTVDAAMQQIRALLERVDARPVEASDGRMLRAGTLLTAIITPLYAQSSWPALDSLFTSVTAGDADRAFQLADSYYSREDGAYPVNSAAAFVAINCLDYPNEVDIDRMRAEADQLAALAPTIGAFRGYGDVGCSGWPYPAVEEREAVEAAGADPILVVGTTGDPATPYRWAMQLASQLESGVLVTHRGEGHTAYGKNDCIDSTVDAYLLEGSVPETDPVCT